VWTSRPPVKCGVMPGLEALGEARYLPPDRLTVCLNATLARRSLWEFAVQAWHVHHPGEEIEDNWHLHAICDHLEAVDRGEVRKLLINIQPKSLKSYLTSVCFPAWKWTTAPQTKFICVSAIEKTMIRDAVRMRELVQSEWYQDTFQPEWGFSKAQDAKTYYVNTAGGHRISMTTGTAITGGESDIQIIDDPHDAQNALKSSVRMQNDILFLDNVLPSRANHKDDPRIVIMQRLHDFDYSGHILRTKTGWVHLNIPNEWDGETHENETGYRDPRTVPGELMCEARVDAVRIAELKEELGEVGYEGQFQQRPAPPGGTIFKLTLMNRWIPGELPEFDFLCTSLDCAFKESHETDYVVDQLWGVKGALRYLLAQIRQRMDLNGTCAAVLEMLRFARVQFKQTPRFTVVELKANGPKVIERLDEIVPGLVGYNPQGESKMSRANSVQPFYAAGQVYIPHPDHFKWVQDEYLPELLFFPKWRHDDQVDATTQALLKIHEFTEFNVVSLGSVGRKQTFQP